MFRNGLQPTHIIVLVVVILLVFGFSRLPDIASSIGKAMKVFKKEVKELREDDAPPASGETGTGGQGATGGQDGTGQAPQAGPASSGDGPQTDDPAVRRSETTSPNSAG